MWRTAMCLCVLVACRKEGEREPAPAPAVAPAPVRIDASVPAPPDATLVPRGGECGGGKACAPGQTCVGWSTESGEHHDTCEIPCGPDHSCPTGAGGCVEQGGGPSDVCLER